MKRAIGLIVAIGLLASISGCIYDPGYAYTRGDGYYGDAYYGRRAAYYDDGPYYGGYGGYYSPYYYGGGLGLSLYYSDHDRGHWRGHERRDYVRRDGGGHRDHDGGRGGDRGDRGGHHDRH